MAWYWILFIFLASLVFLYTTSLLIFNFEKVRIISKSSLIFFKRNFITFFTFGLFFISAFAISISTASSADNLFYTMYDSLTIGGMPSIQLNANYFYPTPETYDDALNEFVNDVPSQAVGTSNRIDYNQQEIINSSYADPTPNNYKDNAAWCNEIIWDYPTNTTDFVSGTSSFSSVVMHNQLPGSYYNYSYTNAFSNYILKNPIAGVNGNEWLFCIDSSLNKLRGSYTSIDTIDLSKDDTGFGDNRYGISYFYYNLEAKLNVNVEIDGNTYWMQLSTLPSPDSSNSFDYKGTTYMVNNFIANDFNNGQTSLDDGEIYLQTNLSKDLGIGKGDSISISGIEANSDTESINQYSDSVVVKDFGYSPTYLYPTDQFGDVYTVNSSLTLESTSNSMMVGYVNPQTFYEIASQLYSSSQLNISDSNIDNRVIDFKFNLLTPFIPLGMVEGYYPNQQIFDVSYNSNEDPENVKYGLYSIYNGMPAYKGFNTFAGISEMRDFFTSDVNFYLGYDNSFNIFDSNTMGEMFNQSWRDSTNNLGSANVEIINQYNSYNSIAYITLITFSIITILMLIFIVFKIVRQQQKQLGILKANGFKTSISVLGNSFSIITFILIATGLVFAILPLFNFFVYSAMTSSIALASSSFAINSSVLATFVLIPVVILIYIVLASCWFILKNDSLKLINETKIHRPNIVVKKYNDVFSGNKFKINLTLNNIFNSFSKYFVVLISSTILFTFIILSVSFSSVEKETVKYANEAFGVSYVGKNNTSLQTPEIEEKEFLFGIQDSSYYEYSLSIDTSISPQSYTLLIDYETKLNEILNYINLTDINGKQYVTRETYQWLIDFVDHGIESGWDGIEVKSGYTLSDFYKSILATGFIQSESQYLTLGFQVSNPNIIGFSYYNSMQYDFDAVYYPYVVEKHKPTPIVPNEFNSFSVDEKKYYCTFSGTAILSDSELEEKISNDPEYFYIEYNATDQYCIVPNNSGTVGQTTTLVDANNIDDLLNPDNLPWEISLDSYIEKTEISDGEIHVIVDVNTNLNTGDILTGLDFKEFGSNGSDVFYNDTVNDISNGIVTDTTLRPDVIVYAVEELPLPFGVVIPTNDPDFKNNTSKQDLIDGTSGLKPEKVNDGIYKARGVKGDPVEDNLLLNSNTATGYNSSYYSLGMNKDNENIFAADSEESKNYYPLNEMDNVGSPYKLSNVETSSTIQNLLYTISNIDLITGDANILFQEFTNSYKEDLEALPSYIDLEINNLKSKDPTPSNDLTYDDLVGNQDPSVDTDDTDGKGLLIENTNIGSTARPRYEWRWTSEGADYAVQLATWFNENLRLTLTQTIALIPSIVERTDRLGLTTNGIWNEIDTTNINNSSERLSNINIIQTLIDNITATASNIIGIPEAVVRPVVSEIVNGIFLPRVQYTIKYVNGDLDPENNIAITISNLLNAVNNLLDALYDNFEFTLTGVDIQESSEIIFNVTDGFSISIGFLITPIVSGVVESQQDSLIVFTYLALFISLTIFIFVMTLSISDISKKTKTYNDIGWKVKDIISTNNTAYLALFALSFAISVPISLSILSAMTASIPLVLGTFKVIIIAPVFTYALMAAVVFGTYLLVNLLTFYNYGKKSSVLDNKS